MEHDIFIDVHEIDSWGWTPFFMSLFTICVYSVKIAFYYACPFFPAFWFKNISRWALNSFQLLTFVSNFIFSFF